MGDMNQFYHVADLSGTSTIRTHTVRKKRKKSTMYGCAEADPGLMRRLERDHPILTQDRQGTRKLKRKNIHHTQKSLSQITLKGVNLS